MAEVKYKSGNAVVVENVINEEAPCVVACPIKQDARDYIQLIARGRFEEALRVVLSKNPFPSTCGRICNHPCETKCRRAKVDEPIAIASLKRFLADGSFSISKPEITSSYSEKIAIIGAGPSGLAAANDLAFLGYKCTVFEAQSKAGGMLRFGVPSFRLSRHALDMDINAIMNLGVEIRFNTRIGENIRLGDLLNQGYKAVLIAVGLQKSKMLNIEGAQLNGILTAIPFLYAGSRGESVKLGKRTLIIGGGAVAMDCARTALRMGCKRVHIACLESRKEMPTTDYEIEEAIHEGAIIHTSLGPKRFLGKDGKVTALETVVCKSVFDNNGRFNPTFVEGSESVIEADTIILAIGQASDLSFLQEQEGIQGKDALSSIQVTRGGTIAADLATLCTNMTGVFASGDVVLGRGTLTEAIGQGKKAALAIHDYLRGIKRKKEEEILPLQELSSTRLQIIKKQGRQRMPTLADEVRLGTYEEVELGFSPALAVKEAQRCMNCGAGAVVNQDICAGCLTCVRVCPYDVPKIAVGDSIAYIGCDCQSCGICVIECPAAAISFKSTYEDWGEAELESALKAHSERSEGAEEPLLLNFYCQYNTFPADEAFGEFAKNVKRVRFQCLAKANPLIFLKAFEKGAKGIFVTVCPQDECRFNNTICWAEKRVKYARGLLEAVGIEGKRLKLISTTPINTDEFIQWADQVTKEAEELCSLKENK